MSDRIRTLTITLDADYKYEEAEEISRVICAIRGVADVSLGESASYEARRVVKHELREKIYNLWKELA